MSVPKKTAFFTDRNALDLQKKVNECLENCANAELRVFDVSMGYSGGWITSMVLYESDVEQKDSK